MTPDRERAKRVILEILRQANEPVGKTRLFKVFWLAHLFYSKKVRGYLTDWPIVRMPNGPGIHRAELLLEELTAQGLIAVRREPRGPFTEIACSLTGKDIGGELPPAATDAVREAVNYLRGMTASSISELSHEFSRSWNEQADGEELNVYSDLIPDDVYEKREQELLEIKKAYEELFE